MKILIKKQFLAVFFKTLRAIEMKKFRLLIFYLIFLRFSAVCRFKKNKNKQENYYLHSEIN